MLSKGSRIPDTRFYKLTSEGHATVSLVELSADKRIAVFAVPGAFTPTCSRSHLPGFVSKAYDLERAGIKQIVCISTADLYVMDAWAKTTYLGSRILMLSDGDAEFTTKAGMTVDFTGKGFGVRSMRYAMVVKDGVVETILIERDPMKATDSSAGELLRAIS